MGKTIEAFDGIPAVEDIFFLNSGRQCVYVTCGPKKNLLFWGQDLLRKHAMRFF
jgi:hypothetical protein